jgi:hypothetical protein
MAPIVTRKPGRNPAARDVRRGARRADAQAVDGRSRRRTAAGEPPLDELSVRSLPLVERRRLARTLAQREGAIDWLLAMLARDDLPARARESASGELELAIAAFGAARVDELVDAVLNRHRATDAILAGLAIGGADGLRALERVLDVARGPLADRALAELRSADPAELEAYRTTRAAAERGSERPSRGSITLGLLLATVAPVRREAPRSRR